MRVLNLTRGFPVPPSLCDRSVILLADVGLPPIGGRLDRRAAVPASTLRAEFCLKSTPSWFHLLSTGTCADRR